MIIKQWGLGHRTRVAPAPAGASQFLLAASSGWRRPSMARSPPGVVAWFSSIVEVLLHGSLRLLMDQKSYNVICTDAFCEAMSDVALHIHACMRACMRAYVCAYVMMCIYIHNAKDARNHCVVTVVSARREQFSKTKHGNCTAFMHMIQCFEVMFAWFQSQIHRYHLCIRKTFCSDSLPSVIWMPRFGTTDYTMTDIMVAEPNEVPHKMAMSVTMAPISKFPQQICLAFAYIWKPEVVFSWVEPSIFRRA